MDPVVLVLLPILVRCGLPQGVGHVLGEPFSTMFDLDGL